MRTRAGSFEEEARDLASEIEKSVKSAVVGERRVGVAFSGGLDSSTLVVCAMRHADTVALSASVAGSMEHERASASAKALGVPLVDTVLTRGAVDEALRKMDLPFEPTPMDRSLWCLYYVVGRSASESGARVILLGQMADELFGGYAKYKAALELSEASAVEMMRSDAAAYAGRGRIRDVRACSSWVEARFPFEGPEIAAMASSLPVSYKIRNGVRKAILRRAAVILGVPERLSEAPKRAAQYSSGVQKLVS